MSRSRKKHSIYKDYSRNYTRWAKRQANKVVRKYQNKLPNGKSYRKLYCSYNISDYRFMANPYIESELKWYIKFKRK